MKIIVSLALAALTPHHVDKNQIRTGHGPERADLNDA